MNRLILFSILSVPTLLQAQEKNSELARPPLTMTLSDFRTVGESESSRWAVSTTQRQRQPDGAANPRPIMSGSSTGYVDNAIIGSQVRLRFDGGFGNEAPDRAELFYAKCGCFRELGADPNAPGPAPRLNGRDPNTTRFIETGLDFLEFHMDLEYAFHDRVSAYVGIPVRSISPEVNEDAIGIGDVSAGVKLGLIASEDRYLSFQFRASFPSGDARRGLGTDHSSVEPTLLFYQRFSGRWALGAEFGDWHPIGGSSAAPFFPDEDFSGDILRYGLCLSYDLVSRPAVQFAPVVELVGWHVLGGYVTQTTDGTLSTFSLPEAEGTNIVNVKIGGRLTVNGHNSVYVGYGRALTEDDWYDDIVRLEYRYAF